MIRSPPKRKKWHFLLLEKGMNLHLQPFFMLIFYHIPKQLMLLIQVDFLELFGEKLHGR
jgi:hypothetical protein